MARWLSWLERRPVTAEVVGSIPSRVVCGSAEIGRQARLRILCPIGRVGSSPISRRNEPEAVELPVFLCPSPYIAQHADHHGREGFMAEMIL